MKRFANILLLADADRDHAVALQGIAALSRTLHISAQVARNTGTHALDVNRMVIPRRLETDDDIAIGGRSTG